MRDPRDIVDIFARHPADASAAAAEVLRVAVMVATARLHLDWRVRLGLAVMKLGARIVRRLLETKAS